MNIEITNNEKTAAPGTAGTEDPIGACAPDPTPCREHPSNNRGATSEHVDGHGGRRLGANPLLWAPEPGIARSIANNRVAKPLGAGSAGTIPALPGNPKIGKSRVLEASAGPTPPEMDRVLSLDWSDSKRVQYQY